MNKTAFLLPIALFLAWTTRLFAGELPWQLDYAKALEEAKVQHRAILLDFSATWCGPCRMMETSTFASDDVQQALRGYTLVKIDIDHNPALAARYKVQSIPTCVVLNQFGELVDRHTGYADATMFGRWLSRSEDRPAATATEPASQALTNQIKKLSAGLDLPDPTAREPSLTGLLNLYCAPGTRADDKQAPDSSDEMAAAPDDGQTAKLVEQELRGFTQRHQTWAAACLNDRRLAVRILFAKLFAEKVGSSFQYDPWATSATRAAAAEKYALSDARS